MIPSFLTLALTLVILLLFPFSSHSSDTPTTATATGNKRPPLLDLWRQHNSGPILHRWEEYAATYQRFFEQYKYSYQPQDQDLYQSRGNITMLEIGVQSGGSMIIWPQWFSDIDFTYIGVDINPLCLQLDMSNDDQIHVEIGSQEDPVFLQGLCDKYGPFDIIIDDGGHTAKQMMTTLRTLFPCIKEGGFHVIEDTSIIATKNYESNRMFEGKNIAQHIAHIYESMHYYWTPFLDRTPDVNNEMFDPVFSNTVKSIHMVDSMIVLERKKDENQPLRNILQGTIRLPFQSSISVPVRAVDVDGQTISKEFSAFVAVNSNSFTNTEKKRLFEECRVFCEASFKNRPAEEEFMCAERLMHHAITTAFQTTHAIAPDLFTIDFS